MKKYINKTMTKLSLISHISLGNSLFPSVSLQKIHQKMKKFLLKILNNNYILLFIGFCIVSYIFYIRILLKRIPKDFTISNTIYLILSFYMFIFFIMLLIIKVYRYYRVHYPKTNVNKIDRSLNFILLPIKDYLTNISKIILHSLFKVHFMLEDLIPFSGNIIEYEARLLIKIEKIPHKILILKYSISYIVSIVFILEIIVYKQLDIFYKVLILLLIPLAINYITYSVTRWTANNLESIGDCVTVELDNTEEQITARVFCHYYYRSKDPVYFRVHYKPSYEKYRKSQGMPIEEGLIEIAHFLVFLSDILFYVIALDVRMTNYNETIYPIIPTALYTIGWAYILFLNLYMLFEPIVILKYIIEIGFYIAALLGIYALYYLFIKDFDNK